MAGGYKNNEWQAPNWALREVEASNYVDQGIWIHEGTYGSKTILSSSTSAAVDNDGVCERSTSDNILEGLDDSLPESLEDKFKETFARSICKSHGLEGNPDSRSRIGDIFPDSGLQASSTNSRTLCGSSLYTDADRSAPVHNRPIDITSSQCSIYERTIHSRNNLNPAILSDVSKIEEVLDNQYETPPSFENFPTQITGPSPLESWQATYERHESIACRLQQPPLLRHFTPSIKDHHRHSKAKKRKSKTRH